MVSAQSSSDPVSAPTTTSPVPVLLLKTKSTPGDAYEDLLSQPHDGYTFAPRFVPVLLHAFNDDGMSTVEQLLRERKIGTGADASYGGVIFTSQRAVEAFTKLVQDGKTGDADWPHLQDVPVYSVGPATTRTLKAVPQEPKLQVFGEHTGNGATLGPYIIEHYGNWYADRPTKPPLLFPVGEVRRDIIPKTLMNPALPSDQRIDVTETVIYGTGVMESFPEDFDAQLRETQDSDVRWVVVFSPTGCDSFLRGLGMLDAQTGKVRSGSRDGKTFIATIGPTTRDHLRSFGFEPDVCADAPSPEGVLQGIVDFMQRNR